eukprot:scaffold141802_cov14-Prasinocladus_malaysianus.AAC.2
MWVADVDSDQWILSMGDDDDTRYGDTSTSTRILCVVFADDTIATVLNSYCTRMLYSSINLCTSTRTSTRTVKRILI